jgi:gephyrin
MLNMSKAIDIVLEQAQPLSPQLVNLEQAQGHVLAEPVYSQVRDSHTHMIPFLISMLLKQDPLPPFRASIMDGYAVIAADGTGEVSST